MAGSNFGNIFKITTWGESHGKGVGVIIDGCPSGLLLCDKDIQEYLDRRKPGSSEYSTTRNEEDRVEILSGIFEGMTTGTPIALMVHNKDHHSTDYGNIAESYRPGHADFTFDEKYGFRDYRGGGRSSGRETIGRVAAGAIAAKILNTMNIALYTYTKEIGGIPLTDGHLNDDVKHMLETKRGEGDSVGGVIECVVKGLPVGIGEPVFDKLDANLGKAIMSIGAVKAFEIGDGFAAAKSFGSENNDEFQVADGKISKVTNHSGGTLGGISDGSDLILRAHFKPTPSIYKIQKTVNRSKENIELTIKGRHDPVIVQRAVVVVEAMTALTILDLMMTGMSSKLENIEKIYKR